MSTFLKNTEAMKAAYVAEGRTATNNGWSWEIKGKALTGGNTLVNF